jgi:NCS2 family nucleobase:cation symporter-2
VKKPLEIVYGVDDTPPPAILVLSGLQHAGLIASSLVIPLIVAGEARLPRSAVLDVLGLSLIALAIGAVLQGLARGPIGSGYLCPPDFTSGYLPASLLAVTTGGLPLLFGMTAFAGALEVVLSRVLKPLRPFFPPEISGLVVAAMGLSAGEVGVRYALGIRGEHPWDPPGLVAAGVTFAAAVGLNVWTRGFTRFFCVLIAMALGTMTAVSLGLVSAGDLGFVMSAPLVALPDIAHFGWSFDPGLALPFGVTAVAGCLKTMGNVTTCQRVNDAEWTRPDMRTISGGVLADGLGSLCAGLLGTVGMSSASSNVGLASATGVTSRRVAYALGALFLALALVPKASAVLAVLPPPVIGAALVFGACFVVMSGLQIITSRMLDARKTIVIGMGLVLGVAVDVYSTFFSAVVGPWRLVSSSSLVLATLSALFLNMVFRIGIRRTETRLIEPSQARTRVDELMELWGARWGARRDVIDRATFILEQSIETIVEACDPRGPLEVSAAFDEFNLDLEVSYVGAPLELPGKRPSNEEIMASEEGQRRLAGFLLRRYADDVQASVRDGRSIVRFHFDH